MNPSVARLGFGVLLQLALAPRVTPVAGAELKGTPEELVAHLASLPQIGSVVGESAVKVAARVTVDYAVEPR